MDTYRDFHASSSSDSDDTEEVNFSFNVRVFLYSISRIVVHTVILSHPANGKGDVPANLQVYTLQQIMFLWFGKKNLQK